jgi:hypothetical protein
MHSLTIVLTGYRHLSVHLQCLTCNWVTEVFLPIRVDDLAQLEAEHQDKMGRLN